MIDVKLIFDKLKYEMITLETKIGKFEMFYVNDLGLFWNCADADEEQESYSVLVTDNDLYIYSAIWELYDSIIEKNLLNI